MSFKRLGFLVAIGFTIWAACFIFKSSTVGIDGHRYYALFDDAMISMRYAQHLADGHGLVWNRGERVEGYTNLLMVLIMAIPNALLGKPLAVLSIQILGIGLVLGSATLTAAITYRLNKQPLISFFSFSAVLAYYPLAYWSLLGMETGLLTVLLLGAVYLALCYSDERRLWDALGMATLLGLAYWTRPETPLVAGIILGYCWFMVRPTLRQTLLIIGVYVSLPLLQHGFRWWYYGELFANTYTLKVAGVPLDARLENGWLFIKPYLQEHRILLLLVLASAIQLNGRRVLLMAVYVSMVVYQVVVGGDVWLYWRIMTPATPLALILAVEAIYIYPRWLIHRITKFPQPTFRQEVLLTGITLFSLILALATIQSRFRREILLQDRPYLVLEAGNNINLALAINDLTTETATVGVIWAGIIPYYTEREAIDFLGKSDPYIAALPPDLSGQAGWNGMKSVPGHNKYNLAYSIQQQQPTFVQDLRWAGDNLYAWGRDMYVIAIYKGVPLFLRKNAPEVNWERVESITEVMVP